MVHAAVKNLPIAAVEVKNVKQIGVENDDRVGAVMGFDDCAVHVVSPYLGLAGVAC
jgi:hypothetical protein